MTMGQKSLEPLPGCHTTRAAKLSKSPSSLGRALFLDDYKKTWFIFASKAGISKCNKLSTNVWCIVWMSQILSFIKSNLIFESFCLFRCFETMTISIRPFGYQSLLNFSCYSWYSKSERFHNWSPWMNRPKVIKTSKGVNMEAYFIYQSTAELMKTNFQKWTQ